MIFFSNTHKNHEKTFSPFENLCRYFIYIIDKYKIEILKYLRMRTVDDQVKITHYSIYTSTLGVHST